MKRPLIQLAAVSAAFALLLSACWNTNSGGSGKTFTPSGAQAINTSTGTPVSTSSAATATASVTESTATSTATLYDPPANTAGKKPAVFEWAESTPEEQGLDAGVAADIDTMINKTYPNVYSFLVVRHGAIVYEKYYQGKTKDSYSQVFSVTKSVISALTGIAIREGYIKSVDQKVSEFLPEYFDNTDKLKKDITIRNALTMTGGLEPTDNTFNRWERSKDWFKYAIDLPMKSKPGEKFDYNTGLTHLLSGVITKSTGMNTKEFAEKYLFNDLNITNFMWQHDTSGYYGGGHLLYLTPRDMAKLGYLYLNKGNWGGKQVIPEQWITESTQKQVTVNNSEDYGYLWWLSEANNSRSGKTYSVYSARGYGSQYIIVAPDMDMIVVITSHPGMKSKDGSDPAVIVPKCVIPAVKK